MTRCARTHFYAQTPTGSHKVRSGTAHTVVDGRTVVLVARLPHNSGEYNVDEFATLVASGGHDGTLAVHTPEFAGSLTFDPTAYRGRAGRQGGAGSLFPLVSNRTNQLLGRTFVTGGHELYLVGGSVRDTLAGKANFDDLDYTTDARPDDIERLVDNLGPVWTAGKRFGTIGVTPQGHGQKVEVTTFRAEQYDDDSRKPVVVFGDSIHADLSRRDFTINAMAVAMTESADYQIGELVDPFGGQDDLENAILRTPGDPLVTMSEDPLRIDRAFRFAASWDLSIDPSLADAITATSDRLAVVSAERRTEELRKILAKGGPVLARVMELTEQLSITRPLTSSLRNDATSRALVAQLSGPDALAALVHLSGPAGSAALAALVLSSSEQHRAVTIASLVTQLSGPSDTRSARELIRQHSDEHLLAARTIALGMGADSAATQVGELSIELTNASALRAPLPISGDDLIADGMRPGPQIGQALKAVLAAYLDDPTLSRDQALTLARTHSA